MSLSNMTGALSRSEMKSIVGGVGSGDDEGIAGGGYMCCYKFDTSNCSACVIGASSTGCVTSANGYAVVAVAC